MNKQTFVAFLLLIGLAGCGGPQKPDYPTQYRAFTAEFDKLDKTMKTREEPPLPSDKTEGLKELGKRIRRDGALYGKLVDQAKALEPTDQYVALNTALLAYVSDLQASLMTLADIAESGDVDKLAREGQAMEVRLTGKFKAVLAAEGAANIVSGRTSTGP